MQQPQISSFDDYRCAVGNTQLVELPGRKGGARLFAKYEWSNPTGSIKDRAALAMLENVLSDYHGDLNDLEVLEYSGGNLANAISLACQLLGLRNTLFVSSASPNSLIQALQSRGTDVRKVDKTLGFLGVMDATRAYAAEHPDISFLYQHENHANPIAHEVRTGHEIVNALQNQFHITPERGPMALAAAIGTGGTLAGVSRAMRDWNPNLAIYGVTPSELPYGSPEPPNGLPKFGGSGGIGNGICQRFVKEIEDQVSDHLTYSFPDSLAAKALFEQLTGERIGTSAGAAWLAAMDLGDQLGPDGVVVTVFACRGSPEEQAASLAPDIQKQTSAWAESWFEDAPMTALNA